MGVLLGEIRPEHVSGRRKVKESVRLEFLSLANTLFACVSGGTFPPLTTTLPPACTYSTLPTPCACETQLLRLPSFPPTATMSFSIPTLKRLYRFVLKRLIGPYLVDLDVDQLDVRLRDGMLELRDIRLDCDALNGALGLSGELRVVQAKVSVVRLTVPSYSRAGLMNESCKLDVNDLVLVLAPDFKPQTHDADTKRRKRYNEDESQETNASVVEGLDKLGGWIEGVLSRVDVTFYDTSVGIRSSQPLSVSSMEDDEEHVFGDFVKITIDRVRSFQNDLGVRVFRAFGASGWFAGELFVEFIPSEEEEQEVESGTDVAEEENDDFEKDDDASPKRGCCLEIRIGEPIEFFASGLDMSFNPNTIIRFLAFYKTFMQSCRLVAEAWANEIAAQSGENLLKSPTMAVKQMAKYLPYRDEDDDRYAQSSGASMLFSKSGSMSKPALPFSFHVGYFTLKMQFADLKKSLTFECFGVRASEAEFSVARVSLYVKGDDRCDLFFAFNKQPPVALSSSSSLIQNDLCWSLSTGGVILVATSLETSWNFHTLGEILRDYEPCSHSAVVVKSPPLPISGQLLVPAVIMSSPLSTPAQFALHLDHCPRLRLVLKSNDSRNVVLDLDDLKSIVGNKSPGDATTLDAIGLQLSKGGLYWLDQKPNSSRNHLDATRTVGVPVAMFRDSKDETLEIAWCSAAAEFLGKKDTQSFGSAVLQHESRRKLFQGSFDDDDDLENFLKPNPATVTTTSARDGDELLDALKNLKSFALKNGMKNVIRVTIPSLQTPADLEAEVYQDTVATLLMALTGASALHSVDASRSDDASHSIAASSLPPLFPSQPPPPPTVGIFLNSSSGKFRLTSPSPHVPLANDRFAFEFRSLAIFAYNTEMIAQFSRGTLFDCITADEEIPVLYASPFVGTESIPMGVLRFKSTPPIFEEDIVEDSVETLLCNAFFRLEPESTCLSRLAKYALPDGRGVETSSSYVTKFDSTFSNCAVDFFPMATPEHYSKSRNISAPSSRLLLSLGHVQTRAHLQYGLGVPQMYESVVRDVGAYLARAASTSRNVNEHACDFHQSILTVEDFAERRGFMRVGAVESFRLFSKLDGSTSTSEFELCLPAAIVSVCADSLTYLGEILNFYGIVVGGEAGERAGSGLFEPHSPTLLSSKRSPILISSPTSSPRALLLPTNLPPISLETNKQRLKTTATTTTGVSDDQLNAKQLRDLWASAPDDQLSAKQLRARYTDDVHLAPFVIDDYYSIGGLPSLNPKLQKAQDDADRSESTARWIKSSPALQSGNALDDWSLFESGDFVPISPLIEAAPALIKMVASRPPPPPVPISLGTSDAGVKRVVELESTKRSFEAVQSAQSQEDEEEEDEEEEDGEEDDDDDADDDADGFMSQSMYFAPANDENEMIQLFDRDAIASASKTGNSLASELEASIAKVASGVFSDEEDAENQANDDASLYKSALYESTMMESRIHSAAASSVWHPGRALVVVQEDDEEDEDQCNDAEESMLNLEDGIAKWSNDIKPDDVKVQNFHVGVPYQAGPGSFVPPAAALAARFESNWGESKVAARGNVRLVIRDSNITMRLFGGNDFEGLTSTENSEDQTSEHRRSVGETMRHEHVLGQLLVNEDHFNQGASASLFSRVDAAATSSSAKPAKKRKRDVSRVLKFTAKGVSALFDTFGDSFSSSLSAHDFEAWDEIKSSDVKRLMGFWVSEEKHPRETGAAMFRVAFDMTASRSIKIKLALLPIRLTIDQDAVTLLTLFSEALSAVPSSVMPIYDEPEADSTVDLMMDVRAFKMKIDYYPKRVDVGKLKRGDYLELIHLFSYQGMEVALKRAHFDRASSSYQVAARTVLESWAQDVFNKQLHKLLAGTAPSIAAVGSDVVDIVLLPMDVYRKDRSSSDVKKSTKRFAKTIVVEACSVGTRVASAALNFADGKSRTKRLPRTANEGVTFATQAVVSRAKNLHHTVIAVPLTTWKKDGMTGALQSFVRAVPIAIVQPLIGMGEVAESLFSGVRHQLDKDVFADEVDKWKGGG